MRASFSIIAVEQPCRLRRGRQAPCLARHWVQRNEMRKKKCWEGATESLLKDVPLMLTVAQQGIEVKSIANAY